MTKALGILMIGIATSVWRAYVLSVMWLWFIVATLGVPALSIPAALGLLYTLLLFKSMPGKKAVEDQHGEAEKIAFNIIAPAIVLGMGWIVKLFM